MMKRLLTAGAIALAALVAAACSGCSTILSNDRGALEQTKLDEQALGMAYAAATLANYGVASAANEGLLTRAQAQKAKELRADLQRYLSAAQDAYDAGDAKTYGEKIVAAREALAAITALLPKKDAPQ